ncbi:unnamed protein product [Aureobasidium pullulans]|nr:unnamed protein product [Aureobasidium pullulans]
MEEATALKNKGNDAFKNKAWPQAIDFYSQAIEKYDKEPSFYTNRAQAHIRLEAYGYAVADATKAIELNPDFVKAYYRRAVANTAILRHADAIHDWKIVVKKQPSDKVARAQHDACQKVIKRDAFLKAIEAPDAPSAAEGLDLANMAIPSDYDGVKLGDKMTQEFVDDIIERFKEGKKLPLKYVYQIILAVKDICYNEPTMVETHVDQGKKITVCGDTHGQYFDLMEIFRINGRPSADHAYLFNGDFVDRGSWSCEIALLLYAYKWLHPTSMFLNRGNHETDDMNRMYGFEGECKAKKLNRHNQKQPGQSGLMMEMLWTDPQTAPGRGPSKRGVGLQFGPDVTKRFCEKNGLEAIIRSHEVRMEGYEEEHDSKCITIFSAPNYCDSTGNKGAFINIEDDYKLKFQKFDAVKHPDIKPMAYASSPMMGMM